MKRLTVAVLALALGLGVGLASAAPALAVGTTLDANGVRHVTMDTSVTPQVGLGGFDGTLQLAISPNGIVNGFFRTDNGDLRTVTGGVEGSRIWLDIARMDRDIGRLHIDGRLEGDRITGSTVIGVQFYNFSAKAQT